MERKKITITLDKIALSPEEKCSYQPVHNIKPFDLMKEANAITHHIENTKDDNPVFDLRTLLKSFRITELPIIPESKPEVLRREEKGADEGYG